MYGCQLSARLRIAIHRGSEYETEDRSERRMQAGDRESGLVGHRGLTVIDCVIRASSFEAHSSRLGAQ